MVLERLEYQEKPGKKVATVEEDHEQRIWTGLAPAAWEHSITDGFFVSLYADTVWFIRRLVEECNLNMVLEVGCGTGQIIESAARMLDSQEQVDWVGLDINPKFINHCKQASSGRVEYYVGDATKLRAWTAIMLKPKERRTLVVCVNNTLSIMPEEIRPQCIHQMRAVAGPNGLVFISYWNGRKFRQGLVEYYKANPQLCGNFEVAVQDFERRKLKTEIGYTSHWPLEHEVETMLRCYGVPISDILEVKTVGKGIFAVLRGSDFTSQSML